MYTARLLCVCGLLCLSVQGQTPADLTQLNIDDLANIQVTSASKKQENLAGAPAAIYVLTGDAIREGGFTTLPEALRMVPGLYVVQTNSHSWQISTRGFSGIDNRKMLVLVDGRSVYSPAFGGVFWDLQDIPLEDIDRVEVIRGPGGTLWGANAVNGVINVVTKAADRSQGITVSTSVDNRIGYSSLIQYGGRIGNSFHYRVYGKASYWEPFDSPTGQPLPNSFGLPQGGLRADWALSQKDSLSFAVGEANGRYQGSTEIGSPIQAELLKDTNLSLRWEHRISDRSSTDTFAYCDWDSHEAFPEEKQNTCDFEFQHNFAFNSRHSLIWGGSFLTTGLSVVDFAPEYRRVTDESGFVQYEYVVLPERLRILTGSKFEGNPYSGIEYQPQVRVAWTPTQRHSVWGAFSRAVRDPSRSESDLGITQTIPSSSGISVIHIEGNPHLHSERVKAYELGYRFQPNAQLSLDISLYYNDYSELIVLLTSGVQVLPSQTIITQQFRNANPALGGTAQTHGFEVGSSWRVFRRWTLSPTVTEMRGSSNATSGVPKHLFGIQSRIDLVRSLRFDCGLYHYNALPPALGPPAIPGVPTFNRIDLGLLWRPRSQWTMGVWGRNLQSDRHTEFVNDFFGGTAGEVPRSLSLKVIWQSRPESE